MQRFAYCVCWRENKHLSHSSLTWGKSVLFWMCMHSYALANDAKILCSLMCSAILRNHLKHIC